MGVVTILLFQYFSFILFLFIVLFWMGVVVTFNIFHTFIFF